MDEDYMEMNQRLLQSIKQIIKDNRPDAEGTDRDILGTITYREYYDRKIQKLNADLKNKIKIYLDMNFIIRFRQCIERKDSGVAHEIYELLRKLVKEQKVECVFSEDIKDEILKQSDRVSRHKTCSIIDSLSNGIVIMPIHLVMTNEVKNLALMLTDKTTIDYPVFNYLASIPLYYSSFFERLTDGNDLPKILLFEKLSKTMTFTEVISLLKDLDGSIVPALRENSYDPDMHYSKKSMTVNFQEEIYDYLSTFEEITGLPFDWKRKLTLDDFRKVCPSSYVFCDLHAEMRMDISRTFHKNDYYDLNNCSLAIPNCDYFFTEKAFAHRTKAVLKLDRLFNVKIESSPEVIHEQLRLMDLS